GAGDSEGRVPARTGCGCVPRSGGQRGRPGGAGALRAGGSGVCVVVRLRGSAGAVGWARAVGVDGAAGGRAGRGRVVCSWWSPLARQCAGRDGGLFGRVAGPSGALGRARVGACGLTAGADLLAPGGPDRPRFGWRVSLRGGTTGAAWRERVRADQGARLTPPPAAPARGNINLNCQEQARDPDIHLPAPAYPHDLATGHGSTIIVVD